VVIQSILEALCSVREREALGYLQRINSYKLFIHSFERNVNEGKSDDLRQGMVRSDGHFTPLFGTTRTSMTLQGAFLHVPAPVIHKSRASRLDEGRVGR
jgi:hypothetical protein